MDSYLDDENDLTLKVIASFSASPCDLPSIYLIVSTAWSGLSFGLWFQQSLYIFIIFTHRWSSGCLYSILAVEVRWGTFYGGHHV